MLLDKGVPTIDGMSIDKAYKGSGKGKSLLGGIASMATIGLTDALGITDTFGMQTDTPTTPEVSKLTGNVVEEGATQTLKSDSTRATRRRKTSQGNKQFQVPLANKGLATQGGSAGLNVGAGLTV